MVALVVHTQCVIHTVHVVFIANVQFKNELVQNESDRITRLGGQIFDNVKRFQYLESIVQKNGRIAEYVTSKIGFDCMNRREVIRVLCDKGIPLKVFIKL